jgi:hypothetical protein
VDPVSAIDMPYVNLSRAIILLIAVAFVGLGRVAWKRNA